jgi:hypothetical protein
VFSKARNTGTGRYILIRTAIIFDIENKSIFLASLFGKRCGFGSATLLKRRKP